MKPGWRAWGVVIALSFGAVVYLGWRYVPGFEEGVWVLWGRWTG